MSKTVVVGGGAAGMLAALAAAKKGCKVILYEKNEKLGKKVFITGKGRCNVTNACEVEDFFENVVHNSRFLYSALYSFTNRDMMALLEEGGCPLKTERGGRVFPVSDHSSDVIKALQTLLNKEGVQVCLHAGVKSVITAEMAEKDSASEKERKIAGVILEDGRKETADAVIVATGGLSYPTTGATGDGYRMAKETGHRLVEQEPSLVPFEITGGMCEKLQGLSLKNVEASLFCKDKKKPLYTGFGEMLFTHFGISGPLILSASCFYGKKEKQAGAFVRLDLKPALTEAQLDKRILRDFEENKNRQFKNAIIGLFPTRLIPVMIEISGIHPDKKVNEISKEERKEFVRRIKNWDLEIGGTRDYEEAIITRGGVCIKDVNPSTMESRLVKGLYFAGEVLDVDALTGGFNLQVAWSTGYLAGSCCYRNERKRKPDL